MPNTPNGRANLASLEATVGGLSNTIAELSRRFEHFAQDVYSKLGQRGVAPGTWLGVVSIVITIAGMVLGAGAVWTSQRIAPVERDIARLEHVLERMAKLVVDNDKEIKTTMEVQRVEARGDRNAIREEARAERLLIYSEFKDLRRDWLASIERIQTQIVTRGEHEQRWAAFAAALQAVDRRLDETRKQVADISSPQSSFESIRSDLRELRLRVDAFGTMPPKTAP